MAKQLQNILRRTGGGTGGGGGGKGGSKGLSLGMGLLLGAGAIGFGAQQSMYTGEPLLDSS